MEKKTYEQTLSRLEELVKKIEDPKRDLSGIADDVKEAMKLVKWCREYLRKGEEEIAELLDEPFKNN